MIRLIFVRHGRTSWNVEGRVQGGGGLDEVGKAQSAALADYLSSQRIDAIYASPALRARQTAQAVAKRHGLLVHQRALLRDLNYGFYAGALLTEVEKRDPGLIQRWRARPDKVVFEGGENLASLRGRITRFIDEMAKAHPHSGASVVAATHDSPVRVVASLALGLDDSQHTQEQLRTPLASVTVLEVDGDRMTLAVHKEAGHLRDIDGT